MQTIVVGCATEAMRLADLQPKFLVIERSNVSRREVDNLAVAHGLMFVCPQCVRRSAERRHSVVCWFADRSVPDEEMPRWQRLAVHGSRYEDLTLDGVIVVRGGCRWRGRIRDGRIVSP